MHLIMQLIDHRRWRRRLGWCAVWSMLAAGAACHVPGKVRSEPDGGTGDASVDTQTDTEAPETTIDQAPDLFSRDPQATFWFTSSDANATFECRIDDETPASCQSPYVRTLADGPHSFSVRAADAAGNRDETPAERVWTIDTVAPDTTLTSGPPVADNSVMAQFTFRGSEPDVSFDCSLDNAGYLACTSGASFGPVGDGAHAFAVRARDRAGNVDPSPAIWAWSVDTIAPDVAITSGPANGSTSGPHVVFGFTASDGAVACSFDGGGFAACANSIDVNLPAGPHQFAVRATDAAGNHTTVTRAWTVACSAPDAAGAAGLLHLDDTGQALANAVLGGAPATLGDTLAVEAGDPAALAAGRFGGGLAFTAADSDHVAWPLALAALPELTIELWSRPSSPAGARDVVVSGDRRIALRVTAVSPTTVRFSIAIADDLTGKQTRITTSAAVIAGAWHHVLASLRAPRLRLWVDGVRTEVGNVQLAAPLALDSLRLGGGAATAYDGALDEIWVAQTAITNDDMALARYCPM